MRLALALAFLAASLPTPGHAQDAGGGRGFHLKPAVGLSWTGVSKDPASGDTKAKLGWQIGGTVLLGEMLYFEGGAFYAKKSTDITAVSASRNIDFKGVYGVRIPAMVGYRFGGGGESLGLRIFGGGSAFLVTSVDVEGLSKSDFESPTYGLFAGAGLDFSSLFTDLAFEWSVTDVAKTSTIDVGQSKSVFLNVGLRF